MATLSEILVETFHSAYNSAVWYPAIAIEVFLLLFYTSLMARLLWF